MNCNRCQTNLFIFACAAILACPVAASFGQAPASDSAGNFYLLQIQSDVTSTNQDKTEKINVDSQLQYEWRTTGRKKDLFLNWVNTRVTVDEKKVMDEYYSRREIRDRKNEEPVKVDFENADEERKKFMAETFGASLCEITFSGDGQQVSKRITAKPGAKRFVDNGIVDNASMFHPVYFAGNSTWGAQRRLSMGNGNFAEGSLVYTRGKTEANLQRVEVAGELTNPQAKIPNSDYAMRNARYDVKGHIYYDVNQKRWSHGELDIALNYDMHLAGNRIGSANGKMTMRFKQVPPDNQFVEPDLENGESSGE